MDATPPEPPEPAPADAEALRIQVSALAAQQAALTLEETRLQQREAALVKQEAQLATLLEERRQKLLELREEVRREREALRLERETIRGEVDALRGKVQEQQAEAVAATEAAHRERNRLVALRRRLHKRAKRQWTVREAEVARREAELRAGRLRLAEEFAELQRHRAAVLQAEMRGNGTVELGKRHLADGWQELALAQQSWETCLDNEHVEQSRLRRQLADREAAVRQAEQSLAEREKSAEQRIAHLRAEAEGLDQRIRNQRGQLHTRELAIALPRDEVSPSPAPEPVFEQPRVLQRLAGDLADGRWRLLEQWQHLVSVRAEWENERRELIEESASLARRLVDRELQMSARAADLDDRADQIDRGHDTVSRLRLSLEGWQIRLTMREANLASERLNLQREMLQRETMARNQVQRAEQEREELEAKRRQDLEDQALMRARAEEARRDYLTLWQECQQRQTVLAHDQRQTASQMLAMERLRLELIGKAPNAATAERRLAKLERVEAARLAAAERRLLAERKALVAETAKLQTGWNDLRAAEDDLRERSREVAAAQAGLERNFNVTRLNTERQVRQVRLLAEINDRSVGELATLKAELERVACLLIESGESELPRLAKQAA